MLILNFDHFNQKIVSEVEQEIQAHFPIKSFKTYFDRENFLLTDYRDTECYNAIAIMKSYDGTNIVVQNCNCGYGGKGPNNSVVLLKLLGIPQTEAESYVFHHGAVELYFDKDGKRISDKTNLINVFESRESSCPMDKINLNNVNYFSAKERTLYLIKPHGESIFTLVQLLRVMKPTAFSFYIGMDNSQYIDLPAAQIPFKTGDIMDSLSTAKSFAIVKGRHFDTVCFFDKPEAKALINNLADLLEIEKPFVEILIGGLTFWADRANPMPITAWEKIKAVVGELRKTDEKYEQQVLEGILKGDCT